MILKDEQGEYQIKVRRYLKAVKFDSLKDEKLTKMVGFAGFVAPEIYKGEYDFRCDLW